MSEILIDQSSFDQYNDDSLQCYALFGKIYSQSLHYWGRWVSWARGRYDKYENHSGWAWYYFYKALHTSLSNNEKIVSWYKPVGGSGIQI